MDEQPSNKRKRDDEDIAIKLEIDPIDPVEVYNVNRNENDLSFPGHRLLVLDKTQYDKFVRYESQSDGTYKDLYTNKRYTKKELVESGIIKPYTKLRSQFDQLCIIVY